MDLLTLPPKPVGGGDFCGLDLPERPVQLVLKIKTSFPFPPLKTGPLSVQLKPVVAVICFPGMQDQPRMENPMPSSRVRGAAGTTATSF